MVNKMLVTQALDERDLLVKKINDYITVPDNLKDGFAAFVENAAKQAADKAARKRDAERAHRLKQLAVMRQRLFPFPISHSPFPKLLDRRHAEGIAFESHDREPGGLEVFDDGRERLEFPRIRQPRQIGIHLHDDVGDPHLGAELPQRMRRRRNELNEPDCRYKSHGERIIPYSWLPNLTPKPIREKFFGVFSGKVWIE